MTAVVWNKYVTEDRKTHPPKEGWYLVYTPDNSSIFDAWWAGPRDGWMNDGITSKQVRFPVSHWTEMPEKPEEFKKKK